jgi:hypothetical protein
MRRKLYALLVVLAVVGINFGSVEAKTRSSYGKYIDTKEIRDGAVTDAKIADVSASKITGQIGDSQISGVDASKIIGDIITDIADGAVTNDKIADGAVTDAR